MTDIVENRRQMEEAAPGASAEPTSDSRPSDAGVEPDRITLGRLLGKIAHELNPNNPKGIGAGALAEIRRTVPERLWDASPAFWQFYLSVVPPEWRERDGLVGDRADCAWARLIRAMAEAAALRPCLEPSFGAALGATGYSEVRFVRLLRAEGEELGREVRVAARWLATKGTPVGWWLTAHLVLGRPRIGLQVNPDWAAHRLASEFFHAQAKS